MEKKKQIDKIYELIMQLASGNLGYRASVSDNNDELDAITMGINMLAEELQTTTVSKDYLGRIYKGVVDMLIVVGPDHNIHEVNNIVCKLLSYKEEGLVGKPFSSLFSRTESKSFDKITSELDKKGHCYNIERAFKTKKGKLIPVSLSCSLLYDADNNIDGTLYIAKDISKIKKTQELLKHKNEELNTFIYRVSHDIKGPLASIIGLVNLAKDEMEDADSVKHYISLIEMSAYRLDAIIGDFLELGRLTQSQIKSSAINFEELINEILISLAYHDDYKYIDFRINVRQTKIFKTKKVLLKAVLQNLIDNSVKYRKRDIEKSIVEISVRTVENKIEIVIADNGIGIEKNMVEHVFKMFYKGDHDSKGSGLGLYIVKTSLDALKGNINVKSVKDKGTTFTVELPYKRGS